MVTTSTSIPLCIYYNISLIAVTGKGRLSGFYFYLVLYQPLLYVPGSQYGNSGIRCDSDSNHDKENMNISTEWGLSHTELTVRLIYFEFYLPPNPHKPLILLKVLVRMLINSVLLEPMHENYN